MTHLIAALWHNFFLVIVQVPCQIIHQENSHSNISAKAALGFSSNEIQWIFLELVPTVLLHLSDLKLVQKLDKLAFNLLQIIIVNSFVSTQQSHRRWLSFLRPQRKG